jgi:hypothetical protein
MQQIARSANYLCCVFARIYRWHSKLSADQTSSSFQEPPLRRAGRVTQGCLVQVKM